MKQINITENELIYFDDNGKSIYKVHFKNAFILTVYIWLFKREKNGPIYWPCSSKYMHEVLGIFCNCQTAFLLQTISFFFIPKLQMCDCVFSLIDEPTDLLGVTQSGGKWVVTIGQMLLCYKRLLWKKELGVSTIWILSESQIWFVCCTHRSSILFCGQFAVQREMMSEKHSIWHCMNSLRLM